MHRPLSLLALVGCHGDPEGLADVLDTRTARLGALAAGLYVDGEPVFTHTNDAALDDPFRAGSVSKVVTALAVLQLADAGQVDLDAPLSAQLPAFSIHRERGCPRSRRATC